MSSITDLVNNMVISRYLIAAGITVMAYDWVLTLNSEMRYIWRAKWSAVKAVFLINRYFIPVTLIFAQYAWGGSQRIFTHFGCTVYVATDSAIQLAFFATLHWIVAMRAWALWGRTRLMGFVIWGCFTLYLVGSSFLTGKAMTVMDVIPFPVVNVCFGQIPGFLWAIWLPSMVFETLVFLFTAVKAVHHSRLRLETPILSILYRDGVLYFVFICLNSFANLLVWAVAPTSMVLLIKYLSTALCEVAGSHLILDLIEVGHLSGASHASATSAQRPTQPTNKKSRRNYDTYEMMPSPQTPQGTRAYDDPRWESSWRAPAEWHSVVESTNDLLTDQRGDKEDYEYGGQSREYWQKLQIESPALPGYQPFQLPKPRKLPPNSRHIQRSIQWSDGYSADSKSKPNYGTAF